MTIKQRVIAKPVSSISLDKFKEVIEKRAKEIYLKRQATKVSRRRAF